MEDHWKAALAILFGVGLVVFATAFHNVGLGRFVGSGNVFILGSILICVGFGQLCFETLMDGFQREDRGALALAGGFAALTLVCMLLLTWLFLHPLHLV